VVRKNGTAWGNSARVRPVVSGVLLFMGVAKKGRPVTVSDPNRRNSPALGRSGGNSRVKGVERVKKASLEGEPSGVAYRSRKMKGGPILCNKESHVPHYSLF